MLFIISFAAGMLIVPCMLDSKKNPGNNIFKRAWRDIKVYFSKV